MSIKGSNFVFAGDGTGLFSKNKNILPYPAPVRAVESIFAYLLPKKGKIDCVYQDKKDPIEIKTFLTQQGLNIPQRIWDKGTNLPPFSSNRLEKDSF